MTTPDEQVALQVAVYLLHLDGAVLIALSVADIVAGRPDVADDPRAMEMLTLGAAAAVTRLFQGAVTAVDAG